MAMTRLRLGILLIASSFSCSTPASIRGGRASMVVEPGEADDTHIVQYELEDPKCFETTEELRQAVNQYKGVNQFDQALASKYGWPIGQWCVSNIQDFSNLFSGSNAKHHRYFNEPLSQWDMSRATDLSGMFQNCHWFNQDINTWDVSSVTTMTRMLASARNFNQPLGKWDTSRVTDMSYMFLHAFSFAQQKDINDWNIGAVKTMEGMFRDARSFDDKQLKWDVSHVENTKMMISEVAGVSLNTNSLRGGETQQQTVITMMGS